jgi:DNA N-6-adenine-methyltransferase Dam
MNSRSMGSHHKPNEGKSNDWLTPPDLVRALGPFDLDPCASVNQPWETAGTMLTQNGLQWPWENGFAWVNPPYGPHVWDWLERLADHGNGVALIFARTETEGFFRTVWDRAGCLYFLRGRLYFHYPVTGDRAPFNAGAPSVLVGYGGKAYRRLKRIDREKFPGRFVNVNSREDPPIPPSDFVMGPCPEPPGFDWESQKKGYS